MQNVCAIQNDGNTGGNRNIKTPSRRKSAQSESGFKVLHRIDHRVDRGKY